MSTPKDARYGAQAGRWGPDGPGVPPRGPEAVSDIDSEVTWAVAASIARATADIRAKGERPTVVYVNTESFESISRHATRMGMVVDPDIQAPTLFGLRVHIDDTLLLGGARVVNNE